MTDQSQLEKKRAYGRAWYLKHRSRLIAKAVAENKKHPERHEASRLKYRVEHAEEIAAKTRAWYRKNRPLALARARESALKKRYGITQIQYMEMLNQQGGKCPICSEKIGERNTPPVDHCHKTGKVREILCYRCNTGLGQFLDNPELLRNAVKYLAKHGQITA